MLLANLPTNSVSYRRPLLGATYSLLGALAHAARFLDLSRSNGPKRPLHIEEDETLLDPNTMAEVDDEDGESHDAESSEGEDWADGVTLVSKFMDVDPM